MQDVGLTGNQSIFINTSLCPYSQMMWSKCKRLHELGNNTNFYISGSTMKIKITENSSPIAKIHAQGFTNYFPEVDLLATLLLNIVVPFNFFCVD